MATSDSYPFSEGSPRTSQIFGILGKLHLLFLAVLMMFPRLALAQWNATIGAQSDDLGRQALAFLPNEIWIHAGESITWTMSANEGHTVTFLTSGQIRPPFTVECPGFSAPSASFDGSGCVTSGLLFQGDKFTVVLHLLTARCLGYERKRGRSFVDVWRYVPAGAVLWTRPLPPSAASKRS